MGASKVIAGFTLWIACSLAAPAGAHAETPQWAQRLAAGMDTVQARYSGELGLFVKVLDSAETYSFRGEEWWYLASGVKVPVAVAVLREVDAGRLSLDDKLTLRAEDYVDGAGSTNWQPVGSQLTVRYLTEQMLIHSDNTASDMLIRTAGLPKVNAVARELTGGDIAPITTLADVRRNAYGVMHPEAIRLRSADLMALKSASGEAKATVLAAVLGMSPGDLRTQELSAAFEAFYASRLNSAPLRAYAAMLERIARGDVLSQRSRAYLLSVMQRAQTGKNRLRAGWPKSYAFAHKTGTQFARFCDFGIVTVPDRPDGRQVVIAACSRGEANLTKAENALRAVGRAVAQSGVFEPSS